MNKYNLGLKYDPIIIEEDNGNFSVTKEYNVSLLPKNKIEGIIIQCVRKTSAVMDATGKVYNTSDMIRDLTSGVVQYSNDSYFEIFDLYKNGNSKYADAFQNNAMVQYESLDTGELIPYTYDVTDPMYETYKTAGEINVYGENCFISRSNPIYSTIMSLNWNNSENTPANGLPYLPYSTDIHHLIFSSSDSNILTHSVNVKWNFNNPKSVVKSSVITQNYNPTYGGKKHKHKIRSLK
jgi:hypothetical protein